MIKENKYRIKSFLLLCKELILSLPASIKSFKKHWAEHGKKLPKFLYLDELLRRLYLKLNDMLRTTGYHLAKYVCNSSI